MPKQGSGDGTGCWNNRSGYVVAQAPKDSLAEPAVYPVGVVSASKHKEAAEKFVEFLQSEEAIKVFESYGFEKHVKS